MTCSCPKCNAAIEFDHAGIPDEGASINCSACNARLKIVKESYARVAYGRLTEKSCSVCGTALGAGISCPKCGILYPDFFYAADPAVLKRKAREQKRQHMLALFKGVEFSLPSFKSGAQKHAYTHVAKPEAKKTSPTPAGGSSNRMPMLVVCLIVVLAVSGGGYAFYAKKKAERMYVDTYFKALYGIKTGADLSIKVQSRIANDWKAAQDDGRSFSPLPATGEITRLNKVRSEVDKIVNNQLVKPPGKFAASRETLAKLNEQYARMQTLALSPPNSLSSMTDATEKAAADFAKTAKALKSTLPGEMAEELEKAKVKYKNLREF
ncbi:hypothetical protein OR1_00050 [Geobacter sp. OR-1]|uniref:hypothetical protein n=1 Tax=Geobacter sp. OR-1 TaxID=1266765 RepID=UPI000541D380|nr:hypothetical protein [Geobacter sp. OR-1]GAM07781.1 hypothetical protein OR1_00050 [Geobacter sp. OR-1]